MITNVKYIGESSTIVQVEPGAIIMKPNNPLLAPWLEDGNTIEPYVIPHETAQKIKFQEVIKYAESLIRDAEATTVVGEEYIHKMKQKALNKSITKKLVKNKKPKKKDEDSFVLDDAFSEFEVDIWHDAEYLVTIIKNITNTTDLNNYVVSNYNWTVYVPS